MFNIVICATAHGSSENQMALHDSCHAASSPGNDILPDVILQCSASQFVQQHLAHLRIRWPCMTSVMLPVYLAMTSFLDVILQCLASQFVQQHLTHLRIRWPCMTRVMLPVYLALASFLMSYCNVQHRNLCNSTWHI